MESIRLTKFLHMIEDVQVYCRSIPVESIPGRISPEELERELGKLSTKSVWIFHGSIAYQRIIWVRTGTQNATHL